MTVRREDSIGERLRKARLADGLSQTQLAERCGLSKPTLSRYENDHVMPSLPTLEKIAEALNINVAELAASPHGEQRLYAALRDRGIEIRGDVDAEQLADDIAELRGNTPSHRRRRA